MKARKQFDFFSMFKSPVIATLHTETELKMRKTGNMYYGRVRKRSKVNVIVGCDYANAVNKQMLREAIPDVPDAEFVPHERAWGMRVGGTPFVCYKDTIYLETMVLRSLGYEYLIDGKPATPSQIEYIESMLSDRKEGERQPIEKKVIWRDYKLENIRAVKVGGVFTDFMAVKAFPGVPTPKKVTRKPAMAVVS